MKNILLILLFLSYGYSYSQNCCAFKLKDTSKLENLGAEFKELRKLRHDDCCENFGSGLMNLMQTLQDSIPFGINENKLIALLGEPDEFASKEKPIEHHFTQCLEGEKVLIYHWRGRHDYLYFYFKEDALIIKEWYYAGD